MTSPTRRAFPALALLAALACHCGSSVAPADAGGDAAGSDVIGPDSGDAIVADGTPGNDGARADVGPDVSFDVGSDVSTTQSGDCRTDADCFSGRCVEILPGGFRECYRPPQVATDCQNASLDQCACGSAMCAAGDTCFREQPVPFCGGAVMQGYNICGHDQCTQDSDCANANVFCAPAGVMDRNVRSCVYAACRTDADCSARPGGICAPFRDPCCSVESGLYCVYPNGGCRSNSDCSGATPYCQVDFGTGETHCSSSFPTCPG